MEVLKQPQYSPMTLAEQVLSLFAAKNGYLKDISIENISEYERYMHKHFANEKSIENEINEKGVISEELTSKIKNEMDKCTSEFLKVYGDN